MTVTYLVSLSKWKSRGKGPLPSLGDCRRIPRPGLWGLAYHTYVYESFLLDLVTYGNLDAKHIAGRGTVMGQGWTIRFPFSEGTAGFAIPAELPDPCSSPFGGSPHPMAMGAGDTGPNIWHPLGQLWQPLELQSWSQSNFSFSLPALGPYQNHQKHLRQRAR